MVRAGTVSCGPSGSVVVVGWMKSGAVMELVACQVAAWRAVTVAVAALMPLIRRLRDLVSEEISDVGETVIDHGGTFKTETPGDDAHIFWETHGSEHFWTEDT